MTASFLAFLLDFSSYRGIGRNQFLQHLSNPSIELSKEENKIATEDYLVILKQITEQQKDPYFGLALGAYLNLGALGLIHKISLSAHSIQQALKLLEDFLATNFPLIYIEKYALKSHLYVEVKSKVRDKALQQHILDANYVVMYRELCMMMNAQNITLHLPYANVTAYERTLKASVTQGETHSFTFNTDIVNNEINQQNLRLIEVLLPKYLAMVAETSHNSLFSSQVKRMILHMCSPELPDFKQVSAQFAMSNRTFQRRLTKEGQSFRSITNEVKKELAIYLREGDKIKTQDIAYILGYSEASAYLHAAKEWFGV